VHYSLSTDDGRHGPSPQRWPERGIPGLGAARALADGGIALAPAPARPTPAALGCASIRPAASSNGARRVATRPLASPDGVPLRLPDGRLLLAGRGDSPTAAAIAVGRRRTNWLPGRKLGPAATARRRCCSVATAASTWPTPAAAAGKSATLHSRWAGYWRPSDERTRRLRAARLRPDLRRVAALLPFGALRPRVALAATTLAC
jgi:hypothetical protein